MNKEKLIMENLALIPVSNAEKKIIEKSVNDHESKLAHKVVEHSYRYVLMIEANVANTKRAERTLETLKKECQNYIKEKDNGSEK